jgi:FixJ family two-component response regulator
MRHNIKPTIYIVDDDHEVTSSLSWLLTPLGYQIEIFHDSEAFLQDINFHKVGYGCIILDVRMPKLSGLEVQKNLGQLTQSLPIIFLTGHGDIPMAVDAIKQGAYHFLTKPVRPNTLIEAINQACMKSEEAQLKQLAFADISLKLQRLSKREKQVLEYTLSGEVSRTIAEKLYISPNTVENHRARILRKLEIRNTAELINTLHKFTPLPL